MSERAIRVERARRRLGELWWWSAGWAIAFKLGQLVAIGFALWTSLHARMDLATFWLVAFLCCHVLALDCAREAGLEE